MPALVWNMMMSMSGGWFFIVAAEAIKVGDLQISLPGIGSYLAAAIENRDVAAIGWTIATMGIVILAYDQLLFRPLVAWADKFRYDMAASAKGCAVVVVPRRAAPRAAFAADCAACNQRCCKNLCRLRIGQCPATRSKRKSRTHDGLDMVLPCCALCRGMRARPL